MLKFIVPVALVAFAGWLLGAVETIAQIFLLPLTSRWGFVTWRREYGRPLSPWEQGCQRLETSTAVAHILPGGQQAVFRHKLDLLFKGTPLPLKGTILIDGENAVILGRLFVGPIFLLAALVVGAVAMLCLGLSRTTRNVPLILGALCGLCLPPILFGFSWWLERRRFERMVVEFESLLELKAKGGNAEEGGNAEDSAIR
jgi:hypothetical protein